MNKILITIIFGILILGIIGAATIHFGLDQKDFTENVDKISAEKLCEKISESDKEKDKFKKCKNKDYDVDSIDGLITKNSEGVYMVGGN